jgi:protease-4
MSLDADHIVDRRRMRRKLTFWRVVAVLVAVVAIIAVTLGVRRGDGDLFGGGDQIARISVQGLIRGDQDRVEALDELAKSKRHRAVILHIDSPGGTTAGSEQLHEALRRLAGQKPLAVVVDGMAASGGYIAAMAADHIVAGDTSLVGSIGVLFQFPNVHELLKTVGVNVETIKSSPLKAAPNGYEPTSPEARAAIEAIVLDTYAWFRTLVQERRKLGGDRLAKVSDGRVFTGRQGRDLGLIDEIGNEKTALAWLAREKGVDAKLPVRDWELKSKLSQLSFLHLAGVRILDAVGLTALARRIEDAGTIKALERLNLDGLLALWHPSAGN